jgi:hypothetical protein
VNKSFNCALTEKKCGDVSIANSLVDGLIDMSGGLFTQDLFGGG